MDIFALHILLIVSLSVSRLSDAHARTRPALILYFKLNTGCQEIQDGPLCKNGNARVNLWHL